METASFLVHDLLHFAVESEARLRGLFYGLLGGLAAMKSWPSPAARRWAARSPLPSASLAH